MTKVSLLTFFTLNIPRTKFFYIIIEVTIEVNTLTNSQVPVTLGLLPNYNTKILDMK
jgi:hypothetical protein